MDADSDTVSRRLYKKHFICGPTAAAKNRRGWRTRTAPLKADVLAFPIDPVGELVRWAAERLRVPPGHAAAGQPMIIPDWGVKFLKAGFTAHESALERRAGKTEKVRSARSWPWGISAARCGGPAGAARSHRPARKRPPSCATRSPVIAEASGLPVTIRKSPYPGAIISNTGTAGNPGGGTYRRSRFRLRLGNRG